MKINLYKPKTPHSVGRQQFINSIYDRFACDHDLELYDKVDHNARYFVESANGTEYIVIWLQSIGWKVRYWYIGPSYVGKDIAYGFDFDETCPLYVEAMLRHSDES